MSTIAPTESDRHRQPMPAPKQPGPKAGNWFALLIIGSLAVFIIPMALIVAVAIGAGALIGFCVGVALF